MAAKDALPSLTAEGTIRRRFHNADLAWRSPGDGFTVSGPRNSRWGNRQFPTRKRHQQPESGDRQARADWTFRPDGPWRLEMTRGAFGCRLPAPPSAIPGVLFGAPLRARPGNGLMDTRAPRPTCLSTGRLWAWALRPRGRTGRDGNRGCCSGCRSRSCCGWPSGGSPVCCSRSRPAPRAGRLSARSPAKDDTGEDRPA